MGLKESLKLKTGGKVALNGGLVMCPRNAAPYTLFNIIKVFPSSSLNATIIGTAFSYIAGAFDSYFSHFHLAMQILGLNSLNLVFCQLVWVGKCHLGSKLICRGVAIIVSWCKCFQKKLVVGHLFWIGE